MTEGIAGKCGRKTTLACSQDPVRLLAEPKTLFSCRMEHDEGLRATMHGAKIGAYWCDMEGNIRSFPVIIATKQKGIITKCILF
jgi:hypothetical protein